MDYELPLAVEGSSTKEIEPDGAQILAEIKYMFMFYVSHQRNMKQKDKVEFDSAIETYIINRTNPVGNRYKNLVNVFNKMIKKYSVMYPPVEEK